MRKHIYGLYGRNPVFGVEQLQVACLGGRVAAHIDDALRFSPKDDVHHILVHACPWGVGNDDVGPAVLLDKVIGQQVLHVAGVEEGVGNAVDVRIDFGILYGLGYILDAYHLASLSSYEVGNRSRTCVEVIDQLVACQAGKFAGYLIELVGLLAVSLVERLGSYFEA